MKIAILIFSILSFVSGILLVMVSFSNPLHILAYVLLGVLCIYASIYYTIGKNPYGYKGFGDLSVFIFFGWIGVYAMYYLFSHKWTPLVLLPATSMGLLAATVLNLNNMRDIKNDAATGKHTLAVKIGLSNAKLLHYFSTIIALSCIVLFALFNHFSLQNYIFVIIFPFFIKMGKQILAINSPIDFDPFLKKTAISTFLLSLFFLISILIK